MLVPVIDWEKCQVCSPCLAKRACKTRAIVQIDLDEAPYVELSRCSQCGECVTACCCDAISMKNSGTGGMVSFSR